MAVKIEEISSTLINNKLEYNSRDQGLISSFDIDTKLDPSGYIEYSIYDLNNNLIDINYNYNSYTILNDGQSALDSNINQINIDPQKDLENNSFNQGEFNVYYNILSRKIGSELETLYLSEISSDRTEIRLDTLNLDTITLIEQTQNFINERQESEYFLDFYINFGDNNLFIANNIVLADEDTDDPTVLIKLYEPLPNEYSLKDELWVVTSIEDPLAYKITFEEEPIIVEDSIPLKPANFNLDLKGQVNNSTLQLSKESIFNTSLSSSKEQINSLLNEKEISINIDYSDFSNFIHFSSLQTRLENFAFKVGLIEQHSASISTLETEIVGATSESIAILGNKSSFNQKINDIITNFDHYEYFLYYDSGSLSWPKTNSSPPFLLHKTGSTDALEWLGSANETSDYYGGIALSASRFDDDNKDNLIDSIPSYLKDDPNNRRYELFINMVAQHYDNIWIYLKDVTEKFNSDNRLDFGVSKDLVADTIRDFGVKLYQNNFSNDDLYTAFLGLTPEGSLFPFPNITGSIPSPSGIPSGFEFIDTLISASNDIIPLNDVEKSLYKRIYHNIPYLLKSKGTIPGLRTLINTYGIPDTILRISEFGGKDKVNTNDWDLYQNNFNYTFNNNGNNFISSSFILNNSWTGSSTLETDGRPSTVGFRFKSDEIIPTNVSQSIFSLYNGTTLVSDLVLEYTGSGLTSASHSGSTFDPNYQYATLKWIPDTTTTSNSASISLPFFNQDWWSVMITSGSTNGFELTSANKIYDNGDTGTSLGYIASAFIDAGSWNSTTKAFFTTSSTDNNKAFSGSLQEIRYYNTILSESVFKDYVMNPLSIEGNTLNSSPDQLAFRAPLGSELDRTSTTSIHPKITGSWVSYTSSFTSNSNFYIDSTATYKGNTETFFQDQPAVGIKNRVTDKVRVEDNVIPTGDTLSSFQSIRQYPAISSSYTPNVNYLEVAFSPQNEINDDINNQLGYFNIGDYIGDPRHRSSSVNNYPDLDVLRDDYFKKYLKNYDIFDFVRLIKYFDNSLFKMIKDFVPARTSLATGIVIKQHLLERNRYKSPTVDSNSDIANYVDDSNQFNQSLTFKDITLEGTVKPQWNNYEDEKLTNTSGGPGGSFNIFNSLNTSPSGVDGAGPRNRFDISQSWDENYSSLSGSIPITQDTQDEFYNGEFSGSRLTVTVQNINPGCDPFKRVEASNPLNIEYTRSFDCQPLLNNVTSSRRSVTYEAIDYGSDILSPVNFNNIIDDTAVKAEVQDSNYTLLRSITPRYLGSKNQSFDFNVFTKPTSSRFGISSITDFGDPIVKGTFGRTPSVSVLDANIYEFEYGGGTTPEIVGWGGFKLGNILQISGKDAVRNVKASEGLTTRLISSKTPVSQDISRNYRSILSDDGATEIFPPQSVVTRSIDNDYYWLTPQDYSDYYAILNTNNPVNHRISLNMYPNSTAGSNPTIPRTTKIVTTEFGVPTISNFALTSSNNVDVTDVTGGSGNTVNTYGWTRDGYSTIYLYRNQHISRVTTDDNGFYQAADKVKPNLQGITDRINRDLNNGEKWFVTLFEEFEFPNNKGDYNAGLSSGSLTPYNVGYSGSDDNGNYPDPLAYKGVHEILGMSDNFENYTFIEIDKPLFGTRNIGGNGERNNRLDPFHSLSSIAGPPLGMLIWKARATGKNEFIIVQDEITGGVSEGAFISSLPTQDIVDNFDYITKTYGTNR